MSSGTHPSCVSSLFTIHRFRLHRGRKPYIVTKLRIQVLAHQSGIIALVYIRSNFYYHSFHGDKGTIKRAKSKRKTSFSFLFRAEVPSTELKIVQTEWKTKENFIFLCFPEVPPILSKGTIKRAKSKRKTSFSFLFRAEVPSPKVRLNERKAKRKIVFL